MGWEGLSGWLLKSRVEPIVLSYSVTDSFPNSRIAGWEDDRGGGHWDDLSVKLRWELAFRKLVSSSPLLELRPENWATYKFGAGVDGFGVIRAAAAVEEDACT